MAADQENFLQLTISPSSAKLLRCVWINMAVERAWLAAAEGVENFSPGTAVKELESSRVTLISQNVQDPLDQSASSSSRLLSLSC
jgi:hypothetical protein